jgi:hypothetical protein
LLVFGNDSPEIVNRERKSLAFEDRRPVHDLEMEGGADVIRHLEEALPSSRLSTL